MCKYHVFYYTHVSVIFYRYQVTVFTGHALGAGTTAKVRFYYLLFKVPIKRNFLIIILFERTHEMIDCD